MIDIDDLWAYHPTSESNSKLNNNYLSDGSSMEMIQSKSVITDGDATDSAFTGGGGSFGGGGASGSW